MNTANSSSSPATRRALFLAASLALSGAAHAEDLWFVGRPDTTAWTESSFTTAYSNGGPGRLPTSFDTVVFAAQNAQNVAVQQVVLNPPTFTLGGLRTDSRLTQNIVLNSSGGYAINGGVGITVDSPTNLTLNGGSGFISAGSFNLNTSNSLGSLTLNINLSVTNINKFGPGLLTIPRDNSYSGNTTFSGGVIHVTSGGGLGNSNLVFAGGTLRYSPAITTDYSTRIRNSTGPISIDTNALNVLFASPIASSNTGGLTKIGAGRLTLSAANTYSGPTTAAGGVLEITTGGLLPQNSAVNVNPGGTLQLSRNDAWGNHTSTASPPISIFPNGILASNNTHTTIAELNLAGGTLLLNGGPLAEFPAFSLKGTVTVTGSQVSQINPGTGSFNTINIGPSESAGSLVFNVGDATNSTATDLAVNVPLQNQRNNAVTAAQNNGLTKTGAGTMTLFAANTYTGPTTVNGGTLELAPGGSTLNASAITINSGGLLRLSRNDAWGNHITTTSASVTVSAGGTLASNGTHTTIVNLNLAGGNMLLNGGPLAAFPAFSLKGTLTVSGSQPSQINTGTGSFNAINIGPSESAGSLVLNVADVTGNPAADLVINAPLQNQQNNTVTGPQASSLTKSGPGTLVLAASNTYTGGTTISAGTLQLGNGGTTGSVTGNITNNAALVFDRSDNFTFPGTISGTGSLTKAGPGTLTLSAANTYSGPTNINAGTLDLSAISSVPLASPININSGGTLSFSRNDIWGGSATTTSAQITVNTGGTLASNGRFNAIVNPVLAGGTVLVNGGFSPLFPAFAFKGTVNVTGSNPSVIALGTGINNAIAIGVTATPGVTTFNVADVTNDANPDLTINVPLQGISNPDFSGPQTSGLTKTGPGTLLLAADNTYTGPTAVNAGILQLGNGGTTGSISASSTLSVATGAAVAYNRSDNLAFPTRAFSGGGDLIQTGTGTLTFTGSQTYTGPLAVSRGTVLHSGTLLSVGSLTVGSSIGSTARFNITQGHLRVFTGSSVTQLNIGVDGPGTFTQTGGVVTSDLVTLGINGNNTGNYTISGGALNVTEELVVGERGPGTFVQTGGTVTAKEVRVAYVNDGQGIKGGSYTLSGGKLITNKISGYQSQGNFIFDGGTLSPLGNTVMGSNVICLVNAGGAIFDTAGFELIFNESLPGNSPTGGLNKQGAGTLTLSGQLTYSGNTSITAGKLILNSPLNTTTGDLLLSNNTSVDFAAPRTTSPIPVSRIDNLTIPSAAIATITPSPRTADNQQGVLIVNTLSITGTGFLDLTNNDLIVRNQSLTSVRSLVATWLTSNNGLPGTIGLGSTSAFYTEDGAFTTLAVYDNSIAGQTLSSFNGIAVTPTDILVKYTYLGDTNLDGVVDATDLSRLLQGLNNQGSGWNFGDVNYDGQINFTDLGRLQAALRGQAAPLAGNGNGAGSPIPEPTSLAILLPAVPLMGRRRR